jgi:hypothetical protein
MSPFVSPFDEILLHIPYGDNARFLSTITQAMEEIHGAQRCTQVQQERSMEEKKKGGTVPTLANRQPTNIGTEG